MNSTHVKNPEQIQLIMECCRSGLSDYQWCRERGIHPRTFYNWISKLKKAGYTIPNSENRTVSAPVHQDALKDLLGGTIKEMMEAEKDNHLGHARYECSDNNDYRNGYTTKQVNSSYGNREIQAPQDRNSSLQLIRKRSTSAASSIR